MLRDRRKSGYETKVIQKRGRSINSREAYAKKYFLVSELGCHGREFMSRYNTRGFILSTGLFYFFAKSIEKIPFYEKCRISKKKLIFH